jgi:hypothetical protein
MGMRTIIPALPIHVAGMRLPRSYFLVGYDVQMKPIGTPSQIALLMSYYHFDSIQFAFRYY